MSLKKCTFPVKSGMFLGHIIDKKGIKSSPMQVQNILNLLESRRNKEIHMLIGRVATLLRFISQMIDRWKPLF